MLLMYLARLICFFGRKSMTHPHLIYRHHFPPWYPSISFIISHIISQVTFFWGGYDLSLDETVRNKLSSWLMIVKHIASCTVVLEYSNGHRMAGRMCWFPVGFSYPIISYPIVSHTLQIEPLLNLWKPYQLLWLSTWRVSLFACFARGSSENQPRRKWQGHGLCLLCASWMPFFVLPMWKIWKIHHWNPVKIDHFREKP